MKLYFRLTILTFLMLATANLPVASPSNEKAIRMSLQKYFNLLRTGRYGELYNTLPSAFQKQSTREEVAESLSRIGEFLKLSRMEIGRIEVRSIEQQGEFAVAATTIFGQLTRPITLNNREIRQGRISSQQYLIRENGTWKIASANERTLRGFMKDHPEVATLFPQTRTRLELLSDGKWIRMPGSR